jgi:dTDP-6-deoxy-L-talose 4-dehydrogenase (NAD+)
MKKVLVTGATGFIGNYVIRELLQYNCEVVATSASEVNAAKQDWYPAVTYKALDFNGLSEKENYFNFFNQPDIVIHLAWEGLPNYQALFHFEENLWKHYRLLKNLIHNGLEDITVAGTCLEYGFKEGCLLENMETGPSNAYSIAKDTLRKFLQQLQQVHPFSLKWVRLFYMFGKGQNPKSLFSMLDRAIENNQESFPMSGGEQIRDYLPVQMVAQYLRAIALQQEVNESLIVVVGNLSN